MTSGTSKSCCWSIFSGSWQKVSPPVISARPALNSTLCTHVPFTAARINTSLVAFYFLPPGILYRVLWMCWQRSQEINSSRAPSHVRGTVAGRQPTRRFWEDFYHLDPFLTLLAPSGLFSGTVSKTACIFILISSSDSRGLKQK